VGLFCILFTVSLASAVIGAAKWGWQPHTVGRIGKLVLEANVVFFLALVLFSVAETFFRGSYYFGFHAPELEDAVYRRDELNRPWRFWMVAAFFLGVLPSLYYTFLHPAIWRAIVPDPLSPDSALPSSGNVATGGAPRLSESTVRDYLEVAERLPQAEASLQSFDNGVAILDFAFQQESGLTVVSLAGLPQFALKWGNKFLMRSLSIYKISEGKLAPLLAAQTAIEKQDFAAPPKVLHLHLIQRGSVSPESCGSFRLETEGAGSGYSFFDQGGALMLKASRAGESFTVQDVSTGATTAEVQPRSRQLQFSAETLVGDLNTTVVLVLLAMLLIDPK
jgi:hypothetical protein